MFVPGDSQKHNYLMTDDELRQWQRSSSICCEYDNYYNTLIDDSTDASVFEQSAINMAIREHGIWRRNQRVPPADHLSIDVALAVRAINADSSDDDEFLEELATNIAMLSEGLRRAPRS